MGVEGTGDDDEWRVVTLNFLSLLKRPCECVPALPSPLVMGQWCLLLTMVLLLSGQAKDYIVTQEHISNKNCLMGYRRSYNLTKASSM